MRGPNVVALLWVAACTEYDLKEGNDVELPGEDGASTVGTTPGTTPGGGDGTVPDGATGDTGAPPEDLCFAPEFGYVTSPAAVLVTTDPTTEVTVTMVLSDTAYQDSLTIDAPIAQGLMDAWSTPVGAAMQLGPFAVATELVFGIDVVTTGDHWQSGPASRNADGVAHVAVTYEGDCSWLIGFEDLYGGGDLDYNDVVFRVEGLLVEQ